MHLTKLAFGTEPSSHRYRLRLARYRGLSEAIAEFVRSRPDTGTPLQLLDVGVGSGRTLRYCDTMGLGSRLAFHGVDNGERRLETVFGGARWELKQADIANGLPYPDGRFDIVTISAVLHHVPLAERAAVYRELARVLKPGGRLYVFEHNPRNPLVRYVVARTPIDANAILLDEKEVRHGLLDSAPYHIESDYLMFMPPGIAALRGVDRLLAWLPLGAQYVVAARKTA